MHGEKSEETGMDTISKPAGNNKNQSHYLAKKGLPAMRDRSLTTWAAGRGWISMKSAVSKIVRRRSADARLLPGKAEHQACCKRAVNCLYFAINAS